MKNAKSTGSIPVSGEATKKKAPYQAPVLRVYGAVNQLTNGNNTGTVSDRTSMLRFRRPSDRALKENIVRVGTHPAGFGLYLFDYKPEFREAAGVGRQFGVMADEVEAVLPQAMVMHTDGYKRVDYALLGIDLAEECPQ